MNRHLKRVRTTAQTQPMAAAPGTQNGELAAPIAHAELGYRLVLELRQTVERYEAEGLDAAEAR